ncbi:hypothetical protein A9Q99_03750 [Gammaproteobacteria bacterium 45_16_T64]|nr:hypothetical protein A9Q99_03750 [Gammaproteobacteria bacterium 45_16_T64]
MRENDTASLSEGAGSLLGVELNGAYRIERELADGGMSLVFVAEQISLGRKVVVKVLRPGFDDEDFIQLFLREARINSQINHPAVVSVFDFGRTEDGIVFIAMELLDGVTLSDILCSEGPLPLGNVVWLVEQMCAGVHAAHKLDVVHRDLKPNNIMVVQVTGGDTLVKVLDFGISKPLGEEDLKHTKLGMVMGTPGYLSPEQIQGVAVDQRADIYALGGLLFFALTGKRPFSGASHESIMAKQLSGVIPLLAESGVSDPAILSLQVVLDRAMALNRDDRYSDIKVFWQSLLDHTKQFGKVALEGEAGKPTDSESCEVLALGSLREGAEPESVIAELKRVLKMSEVQARRLVTSQKPMVIRKNLNAKDAERFQTVFARLGVSVRVVVRDAPTRVVESGSGVMPPSSSGVSLPTAGMIQPMTVTQLARAGGANEEPVSLTFGSRKSQVLLRRRKSRLRLRVGGVLLLCVGLLLGVGLYAPWRYALSDLWAETVGGREAARGVSSDKVTLGMSAAFQGAAKELGRSMRLGVETYLKRVNERGGIHGRSIELMALNDGYEPSMAGDNMASFIDKQSGAFAMLGNVGTPTARVILPVALENKMLVMGTFSGAEILRGDPPDRYVFNYRASYAEETAAMIHYFVKVKKLRPERMAVFYQNDGYGKDGLSGVIDALQEYGVGRADIASASYERNTVQVESAVERFSREGLELDAVVLVSTYSASAAFTRLMRQQGFSGDIGNVSFVGSRALAEYFQEIGGEVGEGVLVTQVVPMYDSYASGVLQYREDLARFYPNEEPGFVSLEGYIVAALLCEALEVVGRDFSVEDVVDALESLTLIDLGVGQPLSFSASDHQASHQVWGSKITSGGQFETVDLQKVRLD